MATVDLFIEVGQGTCARGPCEFEVSTIPSRPEWLAALRQQHFAAIGLTALVDESIGSLESHRSQAQLALVFRDGVFSVWGGQSEHVFAWALAHRSLQDVVRACLVVLDELVAAKPWVTESERLRFALEVLHSGASERLPLAEEKARDAAADASSNYSDLDMSGQWSEVAAASAIEAVVKLAQGKSVPLRELAEDFAAVMELSDDLRAQRQRHDGRTLAKALWP